MVKCKHCKGRLIVYSMPQLNQLMCVMCGAIWEDNGDRCKLMGWVDDVYLPIYRKEEDYGIK